MDDAFRFLSPILMTLALVAGACRAHADVAYVTPNQTSELEKEFAASRFDASIDVTKKNWTCDLFGVRSKMQVQHKLALYSLRPAESRSPSIQTFVNKGDEPITKYEVRGTSLEGRGESGLLDQVRITKDGRLVSKLSLPQRDLTVAYAVCTGS